MNHHRQPPASLSLSPAEARKLVLLSQRIHGSKRGGAQTTLASIEHLGYIQIDSIAVVQRAHHHSLWNRNPAYRPAHLERLLAERQIFEYWSHAAAYLPMTDFRFSLPRKQAITADERHWFTKNHQLAGEILARISAEGPLQARDFEQPRRGNSGWWDWKPAKKALEQLFMEGELMVAHRQGFQKVYDLTERVLPDGIDTRMPTPDEYRRHLVRSYLRAQGLAKPGQIGYLLKGMKRPLEACCREMLEDGELVAVTVGDEHYLALAGAEQLLAKKLSRSRIRLLSPFDNLVIQRQRTRELFGFDYQIECYLPADKRQYGYFCLPLLWGQQFVGRADIKADRQAGQLIIRHLHLDRQVDDSFYPALAASLSAFMAFNGTAEPNLEAVSVVGQRLSAVSLERFRAELAASLV